MSSRFPSASRRDRIIHAGTARNAAGQLVTNGGRVLGVTALAPTLREAADRAYAACDEIDVQPNISAGTSAPGSSTAT